MAEEEVIIVFAKPALPGLVKTRLQPLLSPEEAAELHLALLSDTLVLTESFPDVQVELHLAGDDDDLVEFRGLYPGRAVRRQEGDDLGARIVHGFTKSFDRAVERALILGSDHPTLPIEYLSQALNQLQSVDIVFGPSRDGGYYMVGVRRLAWPLARAAFQDIPWSTPAVLQDSRRRAQEAGLKVGLTPEWYDVDRPEALELLARDARPESASRRLLIEIMRRRCAPGR
jgi:rSAM/selenodomain-associated transferase 1